MAVSPKSRRPRAERYYLNIPPAFIESQGTLPVDYEDKREKLESAKLSAPTPGRKIGKPACPDCGHKSAVHVWKKWPERNAIIYSCSYMHGIGGNAICERMWIEAERRPTCVSCKTARVRIEEHGKRFGYCCDLCNSFNLYSDKAT